MTVGIGVLCESGNAIILAADSRASYGDPTVMTHDACGKLYEIEEAHIHVAVAGSISTCHMIESEFHEQVLKLPGPNYKLEEIKNAIQEARFRAYYTRCDENLRRECLISVGQYQTDPKISPGLRKIARRIMKQTGIPAQMIVAGFDGNHRPILLAFSHKDDIEEQPSPGYFVIGSGGQLAGEWLAYRKQDSHMSAPRSFWHLCEAMKFACLDPTVGGTWSFVLIRADGKKHLSGQDTYVQSLADSFFLRGTETLDSMDARKEFENTFGNTP